MYSGRSGCSTIITLRAFGSASNELYIFINDADDAEQGDLTREKQIVNSSVNVLATIYLPPFSPQDLQLV